tara:strand:+ start:94 stop:1353 length:1260 start_codon:yes stop_codon:yes gene_type:complete
MHKPEIASLDTNAVKEIFSEKTLGSLVETLGPILQQGGGKTLVYMLPAASRLGHMTLEPFYVRHFFGETHDTLAVIIHDHRFKAHSKGLRRLHEPRITFIESMNRKLVMMGHFNARALEIGPLTWAVISPSAMVRNFVQYLEAGNPINHLKMPGDLTEEGDALLASMGYGDDRPMIVLHVRDMGYLPEMSYHSFRAAKIETYKPAIDYLVSKGYRVIRIGDKTSVKLEHESPLVVDLPHHPDYSDILDVCCMAKARFAITCSSGPESMARALGTPMLTLNGYIQPDYWLNHDDVLLLKTYRDTATGEKISYDSMLSKNLFLETTTEGFERAGITLEDNTPHEILEAVQEMDMRISGTYVPDEALDNRFHELSVQHLARYRSELPDIGPGEQDRFETYAFALPWTRYSQSFMQANPWFLR